MSDTCANCGGEAYRELSAPIEWEDYLREQRDYNPFGGIMIPLCPECYPEMDLLKNTTGEIGYYDEDRRASIQTEIHAALDGLDVAQLTDTSL